MVDVEAVSDLGRLPGTGCIEDVIEAAKVHGFAIHADLRSELSLSYVNSTDARLVSGVDTLVTAILFLSDIAKVGDPVIARVPIDMVYALSREFPVLIEPCKPMSFKYPPGNADPDVTSALGSSAHGIASFPAWEFVAELIATGILAAREYPGFRVIMNVFFKLFLGDHFGTLVKAVEGLRQPLTRWLSGCIPSRAPSVTT